MTDKQQLKTPFESEREKKNLLRFIQPNRSIKASNLYAKAGG